MPNWGTRILLMLPHTGIWASSQFVYPRNELYLSNQFTEPNRLQPAKPTRQQNIIMIAFDTNQNLFFISAALLMIGSIRSESLKLKYSIKRNWHI